MDRPGVSVVSRSVWFVVTVPFECCDQVRVATLRRVLTQGTGGTIVSIGPVTGFMAAPRQAAYGVA